MKGNAFKILSLPIYMKERLKDIWDIIKLLLGSILIIIGVIGLVFPIIPGILFIILGLALLGNEKIKYYFKPLLKKTKEEVRKVKKIKKLVKRKV